MSYFNSNITGGSGGGASGLVTKLVKTITISSSALAEATINISSDINNYKDITNDRIIVELNNASAIAVGDAELTHTYNAETGIITITSTNSNIPFASSSAVELSVNVYVAGAVQLPPPPIVEVGLGVPFYPVDYAWSWDNSSDTSTCTITYKYSENVNIIKASGDFADLVGNHLKDNTFKITKKGKFNAPSSGSRSSITGGDTIEWKILEIS